MTLIEPVKQEIGENNSVKKHSLSVRLWHWLNAIVISGSLITVLINSTILKSRQQAPLVKQELAKAGANVTVDQARSAVHVLSEEIWDLHVYFGYALAALFVFRILAELFQLADQKLVNTLKKALQHFRTNQQDKQKAKHEITVKIIYLLFYLLLVVMVFTGLCLAFDDSLPLSKEALHNIKEVHGFCMYPILAFIIIHIAGVLLAERKDGKGIVSDMINGG